MSLTLDDLRRYAVARSLFTPTTLARAIATLGFVQADPIRAPARAQDLTLRHRVAGYHAGDLERRYPRLAIEEDFFANYGFLSKAHHALMHPRTRHGVWSRAKWTKAQAVLEFVRARGVAHPRDVDAHFSHGRVRNWFGGSTNATTALLDGLHYRGLLRVARREGGTRMYAVREPWPAHGSRESSRARMDRLIDLAVATYAPLPAATLGQLTSYLRAAVPQWTADRARALAHAKSRLGYAQVDGVDWYWPANEVPASPRWRVDQQVRLLAPFDPIVWDRRRFELFWGWAYRFEAYTPASKRKLGYYALPLLWGDRVIGWANASVADGALHVRVGYVAATAPRDRTFALALESEVERLQLFLRAPRAVLSP